MCVPPQVALVALSAGSSYLQFQQQKKAQKDAQAQQIRQNEIAKKNALQRYASESCLTSRLSARRPSSRSGR